MYAKDNKIINNTPVPRRKKNKSEDYTQKKNNTGGQTQQETSTIAKTYVYSKYEPK